MRAPRHYLLVVVYLHSSKEKRETHISLTNSLFFSSSVLSLFIKSLSSALLSLSAVFLLTIFCEKNANSFLSSPSPKLAKKIRHPNLRDRQRKKREEEEPSTDRFFQRRDYSLETPSSKKIIQTQGVFTHTRVHTHTHFCLSRSVNCPSTVVVVVVVSSVVCSRPLSLSFLVRKKKGEEKRKTTEDHPKTVVQRGGSNPKERSNF